MTLALSTRPLGPSWLWALACGALMVWERIHFNLPLQFSPAKTPHVHCLYSHPTHTLCVFPFLQITWFFQFLSPRHILAIFHREKQASCYMTNADWFLLLMELPPCFCQGNVLLLLRDFSPAYSCNIIYGSCSQLFPFFPPQFSVCCFVGSLSPAQSTTCTQATTLILNTISMPSNMSQIVNSANFGYYT